jgi:hypothetical protein
MSKSLQADIISAEALFQDGLDGTENIVHIPAPGLGCRALCRTPELVTLAVAGTPERVQTIHQESSDDPETAR